MQSSKKNKLIDSFVIKFVLFLIYYQGSIGQAYNNVPNKVTKIQIYVIGTRN